MIAAGFQASYHACIFNLQCCSYCLGLSVYVVQWRATKDFRDVTFLGPRIVDKLMLSLIIMTLYWKIGDNHKLSNYNNLAAVLFLWTILPGYAATAFIPTIVLERPLFIRCAWGLHGLRSLLLVVVSFRHVLPRLLCLALPISPPSSKMTQHVKVLVDPC